MPLADVDSNCFRHVGIQQWPSRLNPVHPWSFKRSLGVKKLFVLFALGMSSVLWTGCGGGEPAQDNSPPPTPQEIEANEEMGKVPGTE